MAVAVAMVAAAGVGGDIAADRKECTSQLMGLATCLTYVQEQATAAAPTPDCCAGLKTVLQMSRKCLCVLVKDKDDPNLGLKINVNKALGLPAACKVSANISDCPSTWSSLSLSSSACFVYLSLARQSKISPLIFVPCSSILKYNFCQASVINKSAYSGSIKKNILHLYLANNR